MKAEIKKSTQTCSVIYYEVHMVINEKNITLRVNVERENYKSAMFSMLAAGFVASAIVNDLIKMM